jgi:HIV Tat-specific factor 1
MYAREDGSFSGEALVVYFKEDSVLLAVSLLDDAELRLGDPSTTMRVQKAEFTHKHTTNDSEAKPRKTIDKKKATKRIGKMQKSGDNLFFFFLSPFTNYKIFRKLLEWDDEDGFGPMMTPEDSIKEANKNSRVVVLKHMFTLKELDDDPTLLLDLREDVREECSTLGEVTNVVLYDVCDVSPIRKHSFFICLLSLYSRKNQTAS